MKSSNPAVCFAVCEIIPSNPPAPANKGWLSLLLVFKSLFFFIPGLIFSAITLAQSPQAPSDCKTGCTSNDVQIQSAYLSDFNGNQLAQNFICPAIGSANVYLTLELTTRTPRVGVVIYTKVKNFTPPSTIGSEVTTISQCFGITLNQPTNKVTFTSPFNWQCGTPIVLTDVFIGWGTGNTNFCTGSVFQCPATSSKCYSLPPGQYIPIQTPSARPASATNCSTQPGGTTAVFDLTSLESTVKGSQTNVAVTWFSDIILTSAISSPYSSASGTVYAKVASNTNPAVFSKSTVTLTVTTTPAAPILDKVDNCDGTSTLTATGLLSGASLTWSDGGSGNPRTVSSTTAITVTQTSNGCASAASASVTPAPKTKPAAPALGKTDNCNGTSTITATGLANGATLTWSDGGSGNPRTVSSTTPLTVTQTVNGCTSLSSNSITPAPKNNPGAPTAEVTPPTCGNPTGTISVTGNISGLSFSLNSTNPADFTNSTGVFSGLSIGTYAIRFKNSDGCISDPVSKTIGAANSAPATPVVVVKQAASCSSSSIVLEVSSPLGSDFQYSNNDGAWQTNTEFTIKAGDGYNIKARRNSDNSCISGAATCTSEPTTGNRSAQTSVTATSTKTTTTIITENELKEIVVKAYPNPFHDRINFVVNSPVAGNGSLEVYNGLGQKIKNVYYGMIVRGSQTFELNLPLRQTANLVYVLRVGDQRISGKILQLNR